MPEEKESNVEKTKGAVKFEKKPEPVKSVSEKREIVEREIETADQAAKLRRLGKEPSASELAGRPAESRGAEGVARSTGLQPVGKQRAKKIEKILEKDLEEIYSNMEPAKQQEFSRSGEQTARKIDALLAKGRVKVKKIIELIKKWLSLIPGINKFFLEQEAKIKADEIIKFHKYN